MLEVKTVLAVDGFYKMNVQIPLWQFCREGLFQNHFQKSNVKISLNMKNCRKR